MPHMFSGAATLDQFLFFLELYSSVAKILGRASVSGREMYSIRSIFKCPSPNIFVCPFLCPLQAWHHIDVRVAQSLGNDSLTWTSSKRPMSESQVTWKIDMNRLSWHRQTKTCFACFSSQLAILPLKSLIFREAAASSMMEWPAPTWIVDITFSTCLCPMQ